MLIYIRSFLTVILALFYMPQLTRYNPMVYNALNLDVSFILGFSEAKRAVKISNYSLVTSYLLLTLYANI